MVIFFCCSEANKKLAHMYLPKTKALAFGTPLNNWDRSGFKLNLRNLCTCSTTILKLFILNLFKDMDRITGCIVTIIDIVYGTKI